MPVRAATPADLDEIHALIGELAEFEGLSEEAVADRSALAAHLFGPSPAASVLMAEPGGSGAPAGIVAGFALYYPTFSTFLGRPGIWLEDLYVRPAHRGRGLGRELLTHLRRLTDGRVEWAVLDWNERAVAFYRRLGAVPVPGWTRYRWTSETGRGGPAGTSDVTPHR